MKLLKLDARFEDARRVARCLVGSPVVNHYLSVHREWGEELYFSGVLNDSVFGIHNHEYYVSMYEKSNPLLIPLDTLKFCPFVAMREKIIVKSDYTPCVLNPTTFEVSGLLKKMEFDCSEEHFSIIEDGTIFDMCGFEEITLDLTPILQGELEGCEIVEVEG